MPGRTGGRIGCSTGASEPFDSWPGGGVSRRSRKPTRARNGDTREEGLWRSFGPHNLLPGLGWGDEPGSIRPGATSAPPLPPSTRPPTPDPIQPKGLSHDEVSSASVSTPT